MKTELISENLYKNPDMVLIGGGIMSATLGTMLKQLNPELTIQIIEALPQVAQESSHPWNNAGTGHAALCELNYTPERPDGSIDISKAIRVNQQFQISKHLWGYLVRQGIIPDPTIFIRALPHMSFVRGAENQEFLRKRHAAMTQNHFFESMEFTTDPATIEKWAPLLIHGRDPSEPVAATRAQTGTGVNFGALTRQMIEYLASLEDVKLALNTKVTDINRNNDGNWSLSLSGKQEIFTKFVFIGAGGGALPLLQKSGIPEGRGYGGFPVSGKFLACKKKEIVEQHNAKVYGKAAVGAPPMSVPHLDSRRIDGEESLLFGPYAGFSPKYQKSGSYLDLFMSLKPDNVIPMIAAGLNNFELVTYLIKESFQNHKSRCESLHNFAPVACNEDWKLYTAGQRVQIIKKAPKSIGIIQFGTEVVTSADGSLATVLGASPGASTAAKIILEILEKCFPDEMASSQWREKLTEMVPGYLINMEEDADAYHEFNTKATASLQLN